MAPGRRAAVWYCGLKARVVFCARDASVSAVVVMKEVAAVRVSFRVATPRSAVCVASAASVCDASPRDATVVTMLFCVFLNRVPALVATVRMVSTSLARVVARLLLVSVVNAKAPR